MIPADLRQVEVFLVLCEELSFSQTAERTGITPSRVSQVIRTLEAAVGAPLFERSTRRVAITPLGERLRQHLAPAYAAFEHGFADVRAAISGIHGQLRLNTYMSIYGGPHLAGVIARFHGEHPECRVVITEHPLGELVDRLRAGSVDLLAMRLPLSDRDLVVGPILTREPRVLLVATDHALARHDSIGWEDAGDLLMNDDPTLSRELLDHFIPPRTPSGRLIPRVVAGEWASLFPRVAAGEMVHPTVPSAVEFVRDPGITPIPIRDLPPSETALVRRADDRSPAVHEFVRIARAVLSLRDPALNPVRPGG